MLEPVILLSMARKKDYAALAGIFVLLCHVRLGLSFSSFNAMRARLLPASVKSDLPPKLKSDPYQLAWQVRSLARFVPHASCLTQALTLQTLLHRRGIASELKLGVRRTDKNGLAAHAWVICEGKVLLGGSSRELAAFAPIAEFGSGPQ